MSKNMVILMLLLTLEQIYGETITLDMNYYDELLANYTLMKAELVEVESDSAKLLE